jgi:predicted DNA-binding transcriptional regulator AlpA
MGKSWVYAAVKAGQFPAPKKIGRRSVWDEAAVDAWLAQTLGSKPAAASQGAAA